MSNPLIAKLERGAVLTAADRIALANLTRHSRRLEARRDLVGDGEHPETAYLVLEGFACRYKIVAPGLRQNLALLMPGDLCDLHVAILGATDHAVATLSPCTVADIPRGALLDLVDRSPRIARALWWCTLSEMGTLRAWLANVTLREAPQRMAHLFCELLVRLDAVGLADENGYALPLTQEALGHTLGMTAVHVNRTLTSLRGADLVELRRRYLTIPDVPRLMAYCDFDAGYLHLTEHPHGGNSEP